MKLQELGCRSAGSDIQQKQAVGFLGDDAFSYVSSSCLTRILAHSDTAQEKRDHQSCYRTKVHNLPLFVTILLRRFILIALVVLGVLVTLIVLGR